MQLIEPSDDDEESRQRQLSVRLTMAGNSTKVAVNFKAPRYLVLALCSPGRVYVLPDSLLAFYELGLSIGEYFKELPANEQNEIPEVQPVPVEEKEIQVIELGVEMIAPQFVFATIDSDAGWMISYVSNIESSSDHFSNG
jgi:hypothetical protein